MITACRSAAAAPPASARQRAPGTLLWIGTRTAGEVVEAYEQCEATAPQIAVRATIAEAIARPAGLVRQIVVARLDRSPADPQLLTALRELYAEARMICLLGSGCEGERRTGQPWPGIERVYWHQWNQRSGQWWGDAATSPFDAPTDSDAPMETASQVALAVVVAANLAAASPLLDLLHSTGVSAAWMRPGQHAAIRGASAVLWDDSAAPPASRHVWRRRLATLSSTRGASHGEGGPTADGQPHHLWLVGFPRLHEWHEARRGGIHTPISKPYDATALSQWLKMRPS